jgi:hypothetical protein
MDRVDLLGLFDTAPDHPLNFTIAYAVLPSVTVHTSLLVTAANIPIVGFQHWMEQLGMIIEGFLATSRQAVSSPRVLTEGRLGLCLIKSPLSRDD